MKTETSREVTSLHGLIKVQRMEPPPTGLFVMCPREMVENPDHGRPLMQAEIELYVLMSCLSPGLQAVVKKEMLENSPSREDVLKSIHPDTQAEYEKMAIHHHEMVSDVDKAASTEVEVPPLKVGEDPVVRAVQVIEEELGEPIPDYVKVNKESLADLMVIHGVDELKSMAQAIRKEIDYHDLVHKQDIDPDEARLRVYGPPPAV